MLVLYFKPGLSDLQQKAFSHGGVCLETEYKSSVFYARYRCAHGHEFKKPWNKWIGKNKWCPECAALEKAEKLAQEKGGHCISNHYKNIKTKLRWRCAHGHEWESSYENVAFSGTWCPVCKQSKSERLCRAIFEKLFDAPFPSIRPKWLIGSRGVPLEIDGFCKSLRLGFEYQGKQHYKKSTVFIYDDIETVTRRDKEKARLLKAKGITLIPVKYFPKHYTPATAVEWVKLAIQKAGVMVPSKDVSVSWADVISAEDATLASYKAELNTALQNKGAVLVAGVPAMRKTQLKLKCSKGHIFDISLSRIAEGRWCPYCSKHKKEVNADEN